MRWLRRESGLVVPSGEVETTSSLDGRVGEEYSRRELFRKAGKAAAVGALAYVGANLFMNDAYAEDNPDVMKVAEEVPEMSSKDKKAVLKSVEDWNKRREAAGLVPVVWDEYESRLLMQDLVRLHDGYTQEQLKNREILHGGRIVDGAGKEVFSGGMANYTWGSLSGDKAADKLDKVFIYDVGHCVAMFMGKLAQETGEREPYKVGAVVYRGKKYDIGGISFKHTNENVGTDFKFYPIMTLSSKENGRIHTVDPIDSPFEEGEKSPPAIMILPGAFGFKIMYFNIDIYDGTRFRDRDKLERVEHYYGPTNNFAASVKRGRFDKNHNYGTRGEAIIKIEPEEFDSLVQREYIHPVTKEVLVGKNLFTQTVEGQTTPITSDDVKKLIDSKRIVLITGQSTFTTYSKNC